MYSRVSVQRTYHYFRSSVINVVCVFSRTKKMWREKERSEREKAETKTTDRQQRSSAREKKKRAKNETKIHSFSLSTNWRCWCSSGVVLILILRITTTIKASERCNSSQKLSRKKRKKEAQEGRERFFVRNKRDWEERENSKRFLPRDSILLVVFELASSENESKKDFPRAVVWTTTKVVVIRKRWLFLSLCSAFKKKKTGRKRKETYDNIHFGGEKWTRVIGFDRRRVER